MYSKLAGDGITDDTAAIQALLDHAEETIYLKNGTYLISAPLKIKSNTHLSLSPNTVMKLADGANCAIIENESLPQRGYDHNIIIEGGIWDGNNEHQVRGRPYPETCYEEDYYYGIFMRFVGVKHFTIRNVTIKNPEAYAMLLCNAEHFCVDHITFDFNMLRPNMDGIHVQGTTRFGRISNIHGATYDDMVALNCDDGYVCEITRGVIEDVVVDGIFTEDGYTAVRLLSCGSAMRNVTIRNVFGTYRLNVVCFTHYNIHPGEPIWFDNITLENIYASKSSNANITGRDFWEESIMEPLIESAPLLWFAEGVSCGNVSISNVHRLENTVTKAPTIQVDQNVSIERLYLRDVTQRFVNCDTQPVLVNNGTVEKLIQSEE
ncbi:MAG: hypothetical protein E7399_06290 [Ruminococcaceae bacterium]|nr:hypothetical protein [Oscillospiraceae bacterium]